MTRSMRAVTFLLAVGIAVPAVAGQAVPRTSGTATSSSGGGTSGGGSSSGSSSSGGSSGSVDASGRSTFGSESRTPSRIPSGNGSRTGAAGRSAPAPGGVATGGNEAASSSSSSRVGSDRGFGGDPSYARSSDGRPITGSAAARPVSIGSGGDDFVSFPFYGPWGQWYPWYGGFGWSMGWLTYDPWRYGATRWYWSPYGMWYDPYAYWDPFWNERGGGSYSARERAPRVEKTTGSIRIKSNVASGKIYIDNALVGTVDEFDGLNDGLEVEAGRHTLEIRAEGYVTKTTEINVKVGTKKTERINLDKKK